ncbi:transposase [Nonomuraea bangladeshensis]|uniref:transposase n=1 Tax=Nonomuraea bangladeshensis TaxID=404385 RepID=UPI003C307F23
MERRWVGLDGYEVVGAVRAGRQVLRVRRHGRVVADCSSVAEVARHVELADLCEVVELPVRRAEPEKIAEVRISSRHR